MVIILCSYNAILAFSHRLDPKRAVRDLNKFPFVPVYLHIGNAKRKLVAIKKGETESKSTFRYLYFFIIKPLNPNHHE